MVGAELRINRKNTRAFIAVKPTSIALVPTIREATKAGGYKSIAGKPRDPQTFRIIELGENASPPILQLTDGQQREASFWLLGDHNATVEIGDSWKEGNRDWEVGDIIRSNQYEVRALVAERGR